MRKNILIILILIAIPCSLFSQKKKKSPFKTQIDTVSYCLGVSFAEGIEALGVEGINVSILAQAFEDVINKKELVFDAESSNEIITSYIMYLREKKAEDNIATSKKFLDENKDKEGVVTLPSGLQYIVLEEGSGASPKSTDQVTTHYHGTLIDGTVFDSSVERGEPATFPLNRVIKGWTEALQLMKTGSKWRLFIPADMAYGENPPQGSPIEPNVVLIFDVELISIEE